MKSQDRKKQTMASYKFSVTRYGFLQGNNAVFQVAAADLIVIVKTADLIATYAVRMGG